MAGAGEWGASAHDNIPSRMVAQGMTVAAPQSASGDGASPGGNSKENNGNHNGRGQN